MIYLKLLLIYTRVAAALAAPLVLRPLRMRHQAKLAAQGRSETMRQAA